MNYEEIGKRIRKYRKLKNLSQEQLAEKINISTTHMSHIETGNTKLSLPVLAELASVLEVRTDDLLSDQNTAALSTAMEEISAILEKCSAKEVKLIVDLVKTAKVSMDKYF